MDENTRDLLCFENEKRELPDYYVSFLNYLNGGSDEYCGKLTAGNTRINTLDILCDGLGIKVPEKYDAIKYDTQKFKFKPENVYTGDVFIVLRSAEEFGMKRTTTKDLCDVAVERGAQLIVMDEKDFEKNEMDEEAYPVLLVDHMNDRLLRLFSLVRTQQKGKVVMITGSVGKTTTKQMCEAVTENRFEAFVNKGNTNSVHKVAHHLFNKVKKKNEVYIQEAGAGYKGSVTLAGAMLQPDILILTNVYKHHMENYETLANVFFDKTGPDEFMTKDGIIITNYDDENIRNYTFRHKVVSFAIDYEDADYRAVNIKQKMDTLSCDIIEKATGNTTQIQVKIVGEHNVYNILAAYVLGKTLGLTDNEIKEDFLAYKTEGIRQNLTNIGGTYFNVDCYNVAEESILAMLKSGEKFELEKGARRIAVIGGENKLGDEASARSEAFGRKLAGINVDRYLFCGVKAESANAYNKFGDGKSIRKGFREVSKIPNEYSWKIPNITWFLKRHVKRGDLVMLKGIYHLNMTIAVDKVFGTSFSYGLPHYKGTTCMIKFGKYKASMIEKFKQVQILDAPVEQGKLVIPGKIEEHPVFRIQNEGFKGNKKIREIDFGNRLKNIGAGAFYECSNLKKLMIPWNVKVIEREAFAKCTGLGQAVLQDGVTHIAENAFADCVNLKNIYIPETVGMIEENAFAGCENLVIGCAEKSFAHDYAVKNNISFEIQKPLKNRGINLLKSKLRYDR